MSVIINIDAPDVGAAVSFYEALGLRLRRWLFGGAIAEMALDAQLFHILPKQEGTPAAQDGGTRAYRRHWTPVHLDFVVDDLESAVARAVVAGAVIERTISAHEWGRIAGLADPFGHGICLIQLSEKGYGAVES